MKLPERQATLKRKGRPLAKIRAGTEKSHNYYGKVLSSASADLPEA